MRLIEYSDKVGYLVKKDLNDPEIFETLQIYIFYWFLRTKKLKDKRNAHDLATEMAGDLYMRVINGLRPTSWSGYISSHYRKYLKPYKKNNYKQYFNLDGDPEAVYTMLELFSGSFGFCNFDQLSYHEVSNIDFIEYLPQALDDMIKERARYIDPVELLNFKISLLISLIRDSADVFRLPENEVNYVGLFKNMFKVDLRNNLNELLEGSTIFSEKAVIDHMFKPYTESEVADLE